MNRLPPGRAQLASIRRCGQVYVPYRVMDVRALPYASRTDVFWQQTTDGCKVIITIDEGGTCNAVVMESCGFAIHIAPIYEYLNWGKQVATYRVPVKVLDEVSFEFSLKKDLHHGL